MKDRMLDLRGSGVIYVDLAIVLPSRGWRRRDSEEGTREVFRGRNVNSCCQGKHGPFDGGVLFYKIIMSQRR